MNFFEAERNLDDNECVDSGLPIVACDCHECQLGRKIFGGSWQNPWMGHE